MSFTHLLLPELQSLVLSYLTPQHLLSTCAHFCQQITRSALTPSCFRTHLLLDNRTINALPTMTPPAFTLLTQATSLNVKYGDAADERKCRSLFTSTSSRSLLHFTHVSWLSIGYTDTWDFLNDATPFALFSALLSHCNGRIDLSQHILPALTELILYSVPHYDADRLAALDLTPLTAIPSLTRITLCFDLLRPAQFLSLLQLPNLQAVAWSNRPPYSRRQDSTLSAADMAAYEAFKARGVQLTQLTEY